MSGIDITREELIHLNDEYGDSFEPRHASFFHYTREDNVYNILADSDKNFFFASNLERMNDLEESLKHKAESKNTFSLCFCNTKTENLPLWFLYGGIDGMGVRIGFRPQAMKILLDSIDMVYPVYDKKPDLKNPLVKGKDFECQYGWVYYADFEKRIAYRGKNYCLPEGEFDAFDKDNFFVKRYPWNYEEEFRVLFTFKEASFERIAVPFNKAEFLINNGLRLGFAPNYSTYKDGKEDNSEYLAKRKEIKERLKLPYRIMTPSSLKVNYGLLAANKSIILKHFKEIFDSCDDTEKKELRKVMRNKKT